MSKYDPILELLSENRLALLPTTHISISTGLTRPVHPLLLSNAECGFWQRTVYSKR
ncbi:hypothetical protein ACFQH6_17460 [Halobacteriaceae archaeon GCM10025711]